jgi:AdoMet-dependent heme synthase
MFRKLSAPISVQWEVTPECNYNCVHCYNHWREKRKQKKEDIGLSWNVYYTVINEIIQNHIFAVTVTGGEPLLVFGQILPHLISLREAGLDVSINSNLSLLTAKMAMILKQIGIKSILTSLPSANEITNDQITQSKKSRDRTARGIKRALAAGLHVGVNMTVTQLNLADIFETACFVQSLGVKSFSATKAAIPGNCQDFSSYQLSRVDFHTMLTQLVRVKEKLGLRVDSLEFYPACAFGDETTRRMFGSTRSCTAGKTSCTIGFDGQIRPCSHAPKAYGSIVDGLKTAWDNMEEWRGDQWIPLECQPCPIKRRCGGGCKIEALMSRGAINKPDPFCDFKSIPDKPVARPTLEFDLGGLFQIQRNLMFRKETFGGIICAENNRWLPVTTDLFEYIHRNQGESMQVGESGEVLGQSETEIKQTVEALLSKRIIQRADI